MEEWKQERPGWCPHVDCLFKRRAMDNVCGGELPAPVEHDGDFNIYRLCINEPNNSPFDLQLNEGDLEWFRWIFDALDGKESSWLSKR